MVNIQKSENDRLVRGLSVFTTKPDSLTHQKRIEEARKNFIEALEDGDSRKDALNGALRAAADGNEAKYEAAYAAAYGTPLVESTTEEVKTTSDDTFRMKTIDTTTINWRRFALGAIGLVVGILFAALTWQPLVYDKFTSKELVLLGAIVALLYGILVIIAGLAAGMWVSYIVENHEEEAVNHESLPNEEKETTQSDSSREKLDVH
jgi:hypothetical protein